MRSYEWIDETRFCSNLINDEILVRALTFWLAFLHSPSTCSSKVSLLSIFIPKSFPLHLLESFSLQISTWWIFFVTKKKVKFIWIHFHTVILKPQSKAFRSSLNFINYFQFWTTHCKWRVIISITNWVNIWYKENKLQRKTLKSSGPNMEPCGTPYSIYVHLLNVLFIFIFCFRWLK